MGFLITEEQRKELALAGLDHLPEKLTAILASNHARVLDFFREVDTNFDGCISRGEMQFAMLKLGFGASPKEVDELFDALDPDGNGVIEFEELQVALRMASDGTLAARRASRTRKPPTAAQLARQQAENRNEAAATRRFSAMMKKLNMAKAKSDARKVVKARKAANKAANKEAMTATRRYARMMKTLNSQKARSEAAKLRRKNLAAAKALAKEEERASQLFFRAMSANARKAAAAAKRAAARKPKAAPKPRKVASPKRKLTPKERSMVAKFAANRMTVSAKARRAQKAANTRKAKRGILGAMANANPFSALTNLVNAKPRRTRARK